MEIEQSIVDFLRSQSEVLLSFSGGKDSLACWQLLNGIGVRVVPYYMTLVPELEFVEDFLRVCESHFGEHIYRVTHPNFYHYLKTNTAQSWHTAKAIEFLDLPSFSYEDVEAGVRRTAGCPDAWTVVGIRVAESPLRRARIKDWKHEKNRKLYPIWQIRKAELVKFLRDRQVPIPPDYAMFGRSFDGIEYRYLKQIQSDYPRDFHKILEWFPLHRAELLRVEWGVKHGCVEVG